MEGWGKAWISSTCVVRFKSKEYKEETVKKFNEKNIPHRDWWNGGCHLEKIFMRHLSEVSLKNTNVLTKKTLGLAFHLLISNREVKIIF